MSAATQAWRLGFQLPTRTLAPITRTDVVRYQGASGDLNPIHHDEMFARAAGFSAPVVVGMLPAGMLHAWLASQLGPDNVQRIAMRWKEPVFPGDVLTFEAKVVKRYEEAGEVRVEIELLCTKQTGNAVVFGTATYLVPSPRDVLGSPP
jgi:acyl dehydratase